VPRPLVAFFAKLPQPGAVKTRLCPPLAPKEAAELYEAFLIDLFDRFGRHRAPYGLGVAFAPAEGREWFEARAPRDAALFLQRGDTLAARMSHFFADAFWEGWGPVVIVGTDLPTLPAKHVDGLVAPLLAPEGAADVTLGLDRGGGYWGLGLRSLQPSLFEGLTTSHGSVAAWTLARAKESGLRVARAGTWGDVDTLDDLTDLAAQLDDPADATSAPRTTAALVRLGFVHRDQ